MPPKKKTFPYLRPKNSRISTKPPKPWKWNLMLTA